MQVFRRLYSTIPRPAAAARTASTPRAVRLRRQRKGLTVAPGETDATPKGLTPSELARYQRQLARGDLTNDDDGSTPTEEQWLQRLDEKRTRLRGVRKMMVKGGDVEPAVVAQKIYLPNLVFRLVRNFTPPGQPYNPYEATFRVSNSVTKTDIRSYLSAVYGVQTTYIRTDNYFPPKPHPMFGKTTRAAYKRAVVGLVEPFYYPQALDDMTAEERQKREHWIEESFHIKQRTFSQRYEFLRMTRSASQGWRWRTGATASRGNILRLIAERRALREGLISDAKSEIAESRRAEPAESW